MILVLEKVFLQSATSEREVIFKFVGLLKNNDNSDLESLQVDEDLFLESIPKFENFLNHSCEPNAIMDWNNLTLLAIRRIKKREEVTYNYLTSGYDMLFTKSNWICKCSSSKCYKLIDGFKYLPLEQKIALKDFLSPFSQKKLKEGLN